MVLIINLDSFGVIVFGRRDFSLLSNIMGVNCALNVVLTVPKTTISILINSIECNRKNMYF